MKKGLDWIYVWGLRVIAVVVILTFNIFFLCFLYQVRASNIMAARGEYGIVSFVIICAIQSHGF